MEISKELEEQLKKLKAKFDEEGQDIIPYLEGLRHSRHVDYWDYLNIDLLLNLQQPRTHFPDEMIFIMYHQITELYFKLCIWEIEQISAVKEPTVEFLVARITRMTNYFKNLTRSFTIMIQGMEVEQFLQFRLALYPASGFQSAQYRMIEIACTDLVNLVHRDHREKLKDAAPEEKLNYIYWRYGATEVATGEKSLTLRRFEDKYNEKLADWARRFEEKNLYKIYKNLPQEAQQNEELKEALKTLDLQVNVEWPLQHYKSAARYLSNADKTEDIPATGGTNWQKYLPPRFQRRVFYPEFYSEDELENWGVIRK